MRFFGDVYLKISCFMYLTLHSFAHPQKYCNFSKIIFSSCECVLRLFISNSCDKTTLSPAPVHQPSFSVVLFSAPSPPLSSREIPKTVTSPPKHRFIANIAYFRRFSCVSDRDVFSGGIIASDYITILTILTCST